VEVVHPDTEALGRELLEELLLEVDEEVDSLTVLDEEDEVDSLIVLEDEDEVD